MKIKKTKSGLHSPEDGECLGRSVFDPRAPADRFSNFENEDWEKIAVASDGRSTLLCFIKTDYVDHKMQAAKSAGSVSLPPTIPKMVDEINRKNPFGSLQEKCIALKEAMKITKEEAPLVKRSTREQSKDSKWK